jgi:SAM-dependent methyltransferase
MTAVDPDEQLQRLADESLAAGDPTGWFERLYVAAEQGDAVVPWDRPVPHQMLAEWADERALHGDGLTALVVGCGLGRDAEYLAGLGFDTDAFDISASAIEVARRRHPNSAVRYVVADLLDPPSSWLASFDLVVESMNVQALPDPPRRRAIGNVGRLVAPGGKLVVIALGRDDSRGPVQGPPWPLDRDEIDAFAVEDLRPVRVEDVHEGGQPGPHRWRAEFHRPAGGVVR